MPDDYPPAVADRWDDVLADAHATAEEYREDGWDVFELHPGDVTPLVEDPFGLDVLAPDNEFDELKSVVEGIDFDRTGVYHAEEGGVRFYVVAPEATRAEQAVVIPAFVLLEDLPPFQEKAEAEGTMFTHVRTLSDEERVTFRHDDPGLFF